MLEFDAATTALLDRAYRGRDFTRRRHANLDMLDPRPGETIVDLGCGNGMMLAELDHAMGGRGRIVGLDPSDDMLASADERVTGLAAVDLARADAYALPFGDGEVDGIVSVQVFEYIPDVPRALAECARVLRPAGRLVIGDMDFATLAWASDDPDRMARMLEIWDGHFVDRSVPQRLPGWMRDAGLAVTSSAPVHFYDRSLQADGLAAMMRVLMAAYATQSAGEADLARAWADEQAERAERGDFYFSFSHIVTRAERC